MNNIELLKNHAINILSAYAEYFGNKNAKIIGNNKVLEPLYIAPNAEKYDEVANKVITYLCAYMNVDREEITQEDYMDIKSALAIEEHVKYFTGNKLNADYLYDFSKVIFCENHNISYNEVLDNNLAKKFDKMYLDSYLNYEFKIYDSLYAEFKELKNKNDMTPEDESRLENFDSVFIDLPREIKSKYNKAGEVLSIKEKNFDSSLISDRNFNLCFFKELMKLYNPINYDKDWLITIRNYINADEECNYDLLEDIKIAVGNFYATNMIKGGLKRLPGQQIPVDVSRLDNDTSLNQFFDKYFHFFDLGYRKYEDAYKKVQTII